MRKLSLREFRKLKKRTIELFEKEDLASPSKRLDKGLLNEYLEILNTLCSHDLSDIDFKEWEGFYLYGDIPADTEKILDIDFSETKANLDFKLIKYKYCSSQFEKDGANFVPSFKGCKIRNFDFKNEIYSPEMFDDTFIRENSRYFISSEIPTIREDEYYGKMLSFFDLKNNLQYFKDKDCFIGMNKNDPMVKLFGNKIYELTEKYGSLINSEVVSNVEDILYERGKKVKAEDRIKILEMAILNTEPSIKINTLEKYRAFTDLFNYLHDDIDIEFTNLIDKFECDELVFIRKFGLEELTEFDKETGILSHVLPYSDSSKESEDTFLSVLAEIYRDNTDFSLSGYELDTDDIDELTYRILVAGKETGYFSRNFQFYGIFPNKNYDFIRGEFRRKHNDIFLDEDVERYISKELKEKFYRGTLTAKDIQMNTELIDILESKRLDTIFSNSSSIKVQYIGDKVLGDNLREEWRSGVTKRAKERRFETLINIIGKREFLKICADYGENFDRVISGSIIEYSDEKTFREKLEDEIYRKITSLVGYGYNQGLPESFKEKHPELFLSDEVPVGIKTKFYSKELSFADVNMCSDKVKEELLEKNLLVGLERSIFIISSPEEVEVANKLVQTIGNKGLLHLGEKYGRYLDGIRLGKTLLDLDGEMTLEKIEQCIENTIEINILQKKIQYKADAPEFFKKKHPEMFLAEDAPKDLKTYYYDYKDIIDFENARKPEWKKYLLGKEIKTRLSTYHLFLTSRFDTDTLLTIKLASERTIDEMAREGKEDVLKIWYDSTKGKFLPHHVIMLNFPTDEIDSFFANSRRWSKLMSLQPKEESYDNDEMKTAILKAAYTLGLFKNGEEAYNKIMNLFIGLPKSFTQNDLSDNDYNFDDSFWNSKKINIIKKAYEEVEETDPEDSGKKIKKYILKIDPVKNREISIQVRNTLSELGYEKILSWKKAHQIFDSFKMEYNEEFAKFFYENIDKILSNEDAIKDIVQIQRRFDEIKRVNSGRRFTFEVAQNYIRTIQYDNIDIGNENLGKQASIVGYSQEDFDRLQEIYNEGELRDFSSIPRISGETDKGFSYEVLRCDDPLALTIGPLTDCCQELHGAAESSMIHSMTSPNGRIFIVKDNTGKIVAQSWMWRRQYVGCFDNIEIPNRIFKDYEKQFVNGRELLTSNVLDAYKKASEDLMREDKKVYDELLENGTITKDQYDALCLRKITVGIGYNDIAEQIQKELISDDNVVLAKEEKGSRPYTDARTQYVLKFEEGAVDSDYDNLYVHQDLIQEYDASNVPEELIFSLKRMSKDFSWISFSPHLSDEENSKSVINEISREYDFDYNNTKVLATNRLIMIYSKVGDSVRIGNFFTSPIENEQMQQHIDNQLKKAIKQLGLTEKDISESLLDDNKKNKLLELNEKIKEEIQIKQDDDIDK